MPNTTINSTTQQFLDIYDITNDLVIMKDGTTSLIIAIDAMNFGLLAEEEQDSIMYAYAGLLNSLNYTIQILVRSQTKDVTGYLRLLKEREDSSANRKKQIRIQKYREFVSNLIRERNVLDKKFFVVIPAQPVELGILPPSSLLPGKGEVNITSIDRNLILEKAKNILEPKRDHLIAQFARIGLYSRQLETQEIIQLFYLSYNPEASEGQQIDNSKSYTSALVSAKIEGIPMNNDQFQNQGQVPTQNNDSATQLNPDTNNSDPAPQQEPVVNQPQANGYSPTMMTDDQTSAPAQPAIEQTNNQVVTPTPPITQPTNNPDANNSNPAPQQEPVATQPFVPPTNPVDTTTPQVQENEVKTPPAPEIPQENVVAQENIVPINPPTPPAQENKQSVENNDQGNLPPLPEI